MNIPILETDTVIPGSLEDEARKAITCLYIMVDETVADDLKQRVGAFVCQLKRERDEARREIEQLRKEIQETRRAPSPVTDNPKEDAFYKRHGEL